MIRSFLISLSRPSFSYHRCIAFCARVIPRIQKINICKCLSTQTAAALSMPVTAEICDVYNLSEDVKGLKMKVPDNFFFKAGQWVDFFIEDIPQVGGYSICSSPQQMAQNGMIELAVKRGNFPPTEWIFSDKCFAGATVKLKVGGDFFYDPCDGCRTPDEMLLLIAGGVGINPLLSILRHTNDLTESLCPNKIVLSYTASSLSQLIFKREIEDLALRNEKLFVDFFLSQENVSAMTGRKTNERINYFFERRLDENYLARLVHSNPANINAYICGPSSLIDFTSKSMLSLGLKPGQIHFEKWW